MNYFTQQARGGVIASNINYQDMIGVAIGTQLISNESAYTVAHNEEWLLMCEGEDDLELHLGSTKRVYIQVKNQMIGKKELISIIKNFELLLNEKSNLNIEMSYHIAILKGLDKNLTELKVHLDELHNSKKIYTIIEYENKLTELNEKYTIPIDILKELSIKDYSYVKDETQSLANFTHSIRQTFPIRDFADSYLQTIYENLIYQFSISRKERREIYKKDFLGPIESLIKFEIDSLDYLAYSKTKNGYFKNIDNMKFVEENIKILKKTYWRIWRKWFKYYGLKIMTPFRWYEICPKCNHPLMGNLMGINGIVCPDCGYFPFITLILVCDCGEYSIIKKQPELSPEKMFEYVNTFVKNEECRCTNCKKDLSKIEIEQRIMTLPFPLPMKDYTFGKMAEYHHKFS